MPKLRVNIRVRQELWQWVRDEAQRTGTDATAVVEGLVERAMKRRNGRGPSAGTVVETARAREAAAPAARRVSPKLLPGGLRPVPKDGALSKRGKR